MYKIWTADPADIQWIIQMNILFTMCYSLCVIDLSNK